MKRTRNSYATASTAAQLPARLIAHCASFLQDARHVAVISRVCRAWHSIPPGILEPLWHRMTLRDYPYVSNPPAGAGWSAAYKTQRRTQYNWQHGHFQRHELKYHGDVAFATANTERYLAVVTKTSHLLVWNIETGVPQLVSDGKITNYDVFAVLRLAITDRWVYLGSSQRGVLRWPLLTEEKERVLDANNATLIARCACHDNVRRIHSLSAHDDMLAIGWRCSSVLLKLDEKKDKQPVNACEQSQLDFHRHDIAQVDWERQILFVVTVPWTYDEGYMLRIVAKDFSLGYNWLSQTLYETKTEGFPEDTLSYNAATRQLWFSAQKSTEVLHLNELGRVCKTTSIKLHHNAHETTRLHLHLHGGVALRWRDGVQLEVIRLDTLADVCSLSIRPHVFRSFKLCVTRSKCIALAVDKLIVFDFSA